MSEAADIEERVAAYCRRRQLERLGPLGSGMREQFGERWPVAMRVLAEFEALDIYLLDVSTRNICF